MKKRLLCPNLPYPGRPTPLSEDEAHHATRVLRLREGDTVEAMDGQGNHAFATLRIKGGITRLEYINPVNPVHSIENTGPRSRILPVVLELAILKGSAMEWAVEKAVEIGVKRVIPVVTDHTVVQTKSKGPESFRDRWQKIADQALKQCTRLHRLEVALPLPLEELLMPKPQNQANPYPMTRLWCDEASRGASPHLLRWLQNQTLTPEHHYHILVGPEGGWSNQERDLLSQDAQITHSQRIDLGPQILRAETAAIFASSLVTAFSQVMNTIILIITLLAAPSFTWPSASYASEPVLKPVDQALEIANNQPRIQLLAKRIEKEAQFIKSPGLKADALEILHQPVFKVIQARRAFESEIIQKLLHEGLLHPTLHPAPLLFQKNELMPFIAAPGSVWAGHHSYPGGLLYHSLTNLTLGLHYSQTYKDIYEVELNEDYIRFAAIFHDSAKTVTLTWNKNGSCTSTELQIANTLAHHILGIAEAIYRKYPIELILTIAGAHSPPSLGQTLTDYTNYLRAAAIIAGAPYLEAGLSENGKTLRATPPLEAFVTHMDDHDFVLMQNSIVSVDAAIDKKNGVINHWKRNRMLSEKGDLHFYQKLMKTGSLD